ncbi:MAG: hypothetical protein IPM68_12840 [Flavobacteriales bacterium]|nr:hypothetical protein [Flavobacteriales bacterium]
MSDKIFEIYGVPTKASKDELYAAIKREHCPFLNRRCLKNRKSSPEKTIGTCTVSHDSAPIIICPHRLIQNNQIFIDCIHLLTTHQPGNEIHIVPEITVPGGSIDYVLASVKNGKVEDFVGIELQTLDSTGSIWPARQKLAHSIGLSITQKDLKAVKSFGMNWKMTGKTILVQLHHKIGTFETLNKHLVLVVQDRLEEYMQVNFDFSPFREARLGDSMHLHAYRLGQEDSKFKLELALRLSTDAIGIEKCLGLQVSSRVELEDILRNIEQRISTKTLLKLGK